MLAAAAKGAHDDAPSAVQDVSSGVLAVATRPTAGAIGAVARRSSACERRRDTLTIGQGSSALLGTSFGLVASFKYGLQPWVFLAFGVRASARRGRPRSSALFTSHSLISRCLVSASPGL